MITLHLEITELELVIETLDTAFEIGDDCIHPVTNKIVSNTEYDLLRKRLKDIAPDSRIFKTVTASKPINNKKVTHNPPMTSISKAIGTLPEKTATLKDYIEKVKAELSYKEPEKELVQAYKRDGVAVSLYYENGKFVRAGLRPGNGQDGEDVTENVQYIEGVAKELWEHDAHGKPIRFLPVTCAIRGEIECLKSVFNEIVKDWQNAKYDLDSEPKNPRNYAAGSVRQFTNPKITKERRLSFTGYSILGWHSADKTLSKTPFTTEIERAKYCNAKLRIPFVQVRPFRWEDLQKMEDNISELDYEVDGAVISVNNLEDAEQMGTHGNTQTGNPKAKIAWKFIEESAIVKIKNIEWTPGRSGKLTPVAQFDGVQLDGTTVRQCTVHSLGFLDGSSKASLGQINVGATVRIIKSGKIIPKIIEVISCQGNLGVPTVCPSCASKLEVVQGGDGKDLVCNNEFCSERAIARLTHYLSTLGVKGVSDSIVNKLLESNLVKYPSDFYHLTLAKLEKIGYSKRQSLLIVSRIFMYADAEHATDEELEKFISKLKTKKLAVSAAKLFAALGIPTTGKTAGQSLIAHFKNFEAIKDATLEELQEVEGMGQISAESIVGFMKKYKNIVDGLLESLEPEGVKVGKLTGYTFVFTGGFEDGGKQKWETKVAELGGTISGQVGKNTSYVVVGTDAGSKEQKATQLGIKKLSLEDLKKML